MSAIDILVYEHENILKMIGHIEKKSVELMNDRGADVDIFLDFVDFARNYADSHHHGKEELILFKYMVENLGPAAEKLVNHGMLVEHVLGRMYIKTLEESVLRYKENKSDENRLSILTNAMGYGELLRRHIAKENDVAYTFAKRLLSEELMAKIEAETDEFESKAMDVKHKYESWLAEVVA